MSAAEGSLLVSIASALEDAATTKLASNTVIAFFFPFGLATGVFGCLPLLLLTLASLLLAFGMACFGAGFAAGFVAAFDSNAFDTCLRPIATNADSCALSHAKHRQLSLFRIASAVSLPRFTVMQSRQNERVQ